MEDWAGSLGVHCREENYGTISVFFDLAGTGLKNLDLDYTKQIVHLLKCYYPNNLNYIFVYELPWILTGKYWHYSVQLLIDCFRFSIILIIQLI